MISSCYERSLWSNWNIYYNYDILILSYIFVFCSYSALNYENIFKSNFSTVEKEDGIIIEEEDENREKESQMLKSCF